jgi:DNA-binding MarR family transcriptional regulator
MQRTVMPLLRDNYPAIAKDLLGPMLEILSAARSAFDGDLEKFYVLLVVAMRTAEDRRFADLDSAEVLSGQMADYPSLTTNVRSIADSTGIPKETVRRKVSALVTDGWISRTDHQLALTPRASTMMAEVRDPLLIFAARSYELVRNLSAPPIAER